MSDSDSGVVVEAAVEAAVDSAAGSRVAADDVVADAESSDFKPIQSQEALDSVLKGRLERAQRSAEKKYAQQIEEMSLKLKEFEDAKLSADERKDKRLTELEQSLVEANDRYTKLERTRLVETLAREMGLPEKFWSRVQGSTDDEIISDINDMLEGLPRQEQRNGFVPSQAPMVSVQATGTDPDVEDSPKHIVDKLDTMFSF